MITSEWDFQIGLNTFFFLISECEESIQLKINKSHFLCTMGCSVDKRWPLSGRKFEKKDIRKQKERGWGGGEKLDRVLSMFWCCIDILNFELHRTSSLGKFAYVGAKYTGICPLHSSCVYLLSIIPQLYLPYLYFLYAISSLSLLCTHLKL